MDRKTLLNWLVFSIITIFSVIVIWPPMPIHDSAGKIVRQGKIRLGLDLQGGTLFTVQIDQDELRRNIREKMVEARDGGEVTEANVDGAVEAALKDADGRVLEVLRNRVDKLGVNEPVIAAGKDHRITIQLPGADEKQRADAEEMLKGAAFLQFRLVHKNNMDLVRKLFGAVGKAPEGFRVSPDGDNCYELISETKLIELMKDPEYLRRRGLFEVPDVSYEFMLEKEFLKENGGNVKRTVYRPYFVRRKAEMTGETLASAHEELDTMTGGHSISITLKRAGGERMAYLFNEYSGRHMAIVLDNTLYSAPVLNEKGEHISGVMNACVITGAFTLEEARRLRDVLNCGTLPAPIKIIQRNIVGATLGENAIHSGVNAALIGCGLVVVFMLMYYMYCGFVANIALLTDILLLPAGMLLTAGILSVFDRSGGSSSSGNLLQLPVLTMPGIAGIVLTIGMAVDANVLIFERMREEFLAGKSLRAAISAGYERAFSAIFDSNVCAILTGVILFIFGSGPVRGYAITLVAGIIVSMYTALVLTRLIFEATASETSTRPYKMLRWIKETAIDFMGPRKIVFLFSTAVIVVTFVIFAIRLKDDPKRVLAVDFTGGTTLTYAYQHKVDLESVKKATNAAGVMDALAQYQTALDGSGGVLQIKTSQVTDKTRDVGKVVLVELQKNVANGGFTFLGEEGIGKQVSADLARAGMYAVIFSLVGMLIYLTVRFEFGFALGAIVSLFHDALFTLGVYCIFDRQVSLTIVAALLTIIGYSVNDTIVIMDRIRENLKLDPRRSFVEICNLSINQTLARTVLTHVTVTLVTLALFIFGGGAINDFAFCMLIGMVVGIYSTVYIATPVTLAWHRGRRPVMGSPVKK